MIFRILLAAGVAVATVVSTPRASAAYGTRAVLASDLSGTITDKASGQGISGAEISVVRGTTVVVNTITDDFGRFTVHNLQPGTYSVSVHRIGFGPETRDVTIDASGTTAHVDFALTGFAANLATIQVLQADPMVTDVRTGTQTFKQEVFHASPSTTTSQIVQQSIAGAVRAPTGEVHIRGQHAEYSYYVDGVPVPAGISGSLNELFDPKVVDRMEFQTGGWDAEYGNKNTAIINVTTKIPTGGFHVDATGSGGSFGTSTQGLSMSSNSGRFGLFLSGARQKTTMRQEPILFDTTTFRAVNFHNDGEDRYGFGKLQFTPGDANQLSLDMNSSRTRFAVPFDSSGGATADDHQTDRNSFVNLGWRHLFGNAKAAIEESPAELFGGFFYRHGSLNYVPGASDDPSFVIFPDTTNPYNLQENRLFNTVGAKMDLTLRPQGSHELSFKTGLLIQHTTGREDFSTTDSAGAPGPASNSTLTGGDAGGYVEIADSPVEQFEIRAGVRYDAHTAPFAGTATQVSPRIRLNFFPSPSTTIYVYYGRLFLPTNVEDLRSITSDALGSVVADPTRPERDHFYETGLVHRFPLAGLVTKFSAYYKHSTPGIDDNTVPSSSIVTSVNLAQVWVRGIEGVVELDPEGPFSGNLNLALNHAYGEGPITGGFFPEDTPSGKFDLDHDQRISIAGTVNYAPGRLFLSATTIYGSGLTNGVDPADCGGCSYSTGLFARNSAIHVPSSAIVNASGGYSLSVGGRPLRPEIYIDNVFDKHYLLKGAFFSGASVGRPRSVQVRMSVGL